MPWNVFSIQNVFSRTFGCIRDAIIVAVIHYRRLEVKFVHLDIKKTKKAAIQVVT